MARHGRAYPIRPHYGTGRPNLTAAPTAQMGRRYVVRPLAQGVRRHPPPHVGTGTVQPPIFAATAYTFEGPTGGYANQASTDFTVTPNGTSTAVITPASTVLGTFTPATVTFNGTGSKTFTYTPSTASGSPHTLSVTSAGALTDPANLSYVVTAEPTAGSLGSTDIYDELVYDLTIYDELAYGVTIYDELVGESEDMAYFIGSTVRLRANPFTNNLGAAADPTEVTLHLKYPTGAEFIYLYSLGQLTRDATGSYYLELNITHDGLYRYAFRGTGAIVAAGEESFTVEESAFDTSD